MNHKVEDGDENDPFTLPIAPIKNIACGDGDGGTTTVPCKVRKGESKSRHPHLISYLKYGESTHLDPGI